jgi:hypothetical protein
MRAGIHYWDMDAFGKAIRGKRDPIDEAEARRLAH